MKQDEDELCTRCGHELKYHELPIGFRWDDECRYANCDCPGFEREIDISENFPDERL